jgi:hypothetical protein
VGGGGAMRLPGAGGARVDGFGGAIGFAFMVGGGALNTGLLMSTLGSSYFTSTGASMMLGGVIFSIGFYS